MDEPSGKAEHSPVSSRHHDGAGVRSFEQEYFVYLIFFISSLISLQLKCQPHKGGAAAEAVVVSVGVGVDAVKDGIGVVALVQEIVKFQAKGEALDFIKK